eukprot:jgi/Bigna1/89928/estExt_fgenesh1_pg.C_580083
MSNVCTYSPGPSTKHWRTVWGRVKTSRMITKIFTPSRVIWMFVVVNLLNYVDRGIIPGAPNQFQSFIHATTSVPESSESTYLGLLQSVFIASFSVAVVVAGNFVHIYPPFKVMGGGLAIWCVAVFISGFARPLSSFNVLVLGRALSGDYAPNGRQVLYLGIFFSSITVGIAGGYAYSAMVSTSSLGWGWAFYLEGMLMVPFVIICWMLPYQLKGAEEETPDISIEAGIPSSDNTEHTERQGPSLYKEVKSILSIPVFINISLGYAAYCAVLAGISTFGPIFFQGLQFFPDEKSASLHFSAIVAIAGAYDMPSHHVLLKCIRYYLLGSVCLLHDQELVLVLHGDGYYVPLSTHRYHRCCTMAVMESVPSKMRASAVALNILIMHVLGDVPSPIAVGALKDYLAPNCNTKRIDGQEVLNPLCIEDGDRLRLTLVLCLSWLIFTVIFWSIPLIFPWCGKPSYGREGEGGVRKHLQ